MNQSEMRSGAALVLVLFTLLAVAALGHAALYMAGQEWMIATTRARATVARHAAEGGTALAAAAWEGRRYRGLATLAVAPAVSAELAGGFRQVAAVRRLARELYLIESTGAAPHAGPEVRVGRLVWALDPVARVGGVPGALVSAGDVTVGEGGRLDGTRTTRAPPGWAGVPCDAFALAADSLYPSGRTAGLAVARAASVVVGAGGSVEGSPPVRHLSEPPPAGFGPLLAMQLADLAERRVGGTVTPAPDVSGDGCETAAALNWGAPSDPLGPCGSYFPLVAGSASVTLLGGEGQGVLVVDGDLDISGGARYFGIILARGRLRVHEDAQITGFALAGSAEIHDGGRIEASACAALRALDQNHALRQPFWVPAGSWISLF